MSIKTYHQDNVSSAISQPDNTYDRLKYEVNDRFAKHKRDADILANAYDRIGDDSKGEKIRNCGTYLEFHEYEGVERAKLRKAYFCKSRLCPMCMFRRSLKMYGQMTSIMDTLENEGNYSFLFLTLTVANCGLTDLKSTLDAMYGAWRKMVRRKAWGKAFLGAIRVTEVTISKDGEHWHPHFHCVLAVKQSYFKSPNYLSTRAIADMWGESLGVGYTPICDIRKIRPKADSDVPYAKAVAEVSKYASKPSTYVTADEDETDVRVLVLSDALHNRRLISMSGVFKDAQSLLNADDLEDGDLLHIDGIAVREEMLIAIYSFWWGKQGYRQCERIQSL